jgi:hypothetical protein
MLCSLETRDAAVKLKVHTYGTVAYSRRVLYDYCIFSNVTVTKRYPTSDINHAPSSYIPTCAILISYRANLFYLVSSRAVPTCPIIAASCQSRHVNHAPSSYVPFCYLLWLLRCLFRSCRLVPYCTDLCQSRHVNHALRTDLCYLD